MCHTLAEVEETGREDGWTEEAKEDGATDEFETRLLSLWPEPLSNAVEC